jgi:hypothetical protein
VEARRSTALAIALALLWLAVGYANIARGARQAGAGYRFWAFQHHCYSDIIAMHGDRYLGGGRPLPYLEDRIEYPVLLGVALFLPSLVARGPLGHFTVTYVFLAACLLAALAALARTPGAAPWWLGATPALVYYAGLNWDLLPIALLSLAVLADSSRRPGASGTLAGLGISAKLFPAALVPPAAAALAGRGGTGPARFLGALLATVLAVNLPVALAAPEAWSWFFRYNSGRGAENSIWEALRMPPGPALEVLSFAPLVLAAFLGAVASARAARGGDAGRAVRLATALALVAWIATNKVYSPQYALYGFLAGALAAAPLPLFLVLSAVSAADYHLAFEVRARNWDPWFKDYLVEPGHVVRTLLWLALAAWIARELWRCVQGGRPASGPGPQASEGAPHTPVA